MPPKTSSAESNMTKQENSSAINKNGPSRPKRGVPEGLWKKCPDCGETIYGKEADQQLGTCPQCDHHFYVNATESPWHQNYNMFDYVSKELPEVVANNFPADLDRQGIFGHSMGGHGALTIGLRNLDVYQSISAFSPICSPINCPWGQKALGNYLGGNQDDWAEYDACEVIKSLQAMPSSPVLVDQGLDDQFLKDELHPYLLEEACKERGLDLKLRRHKGYDHGYYFISSFIEDHIRHHADILRARFVLGSDVTDILCLNF